MLSNSRQRPVLSGFTLLEILVTIIVVGIAAAAIMGVFLRTAASSANPLIQQQAIAIAEAYLEEILLKQFCEDAPPPMDAPPPKPVPSCLSESGAAEGAETRATFNDVQDYNDGSIDGAVRDQNGNLVAGLGDYTVSVNVISATLGTIPQAGGDALRIDVTVDHPIIDPVLISGFRANY